MDGGIRKDRAEKRLRKGGFKLQKVINRKGGSEITKKGARDRRSKSKGGMEKPTGNSRKIYFDDGWGENWRTPTVKNQRKNYKSLWAGMESRSNKEPTLWKTLEREKRPWL